MVKPIAELYMISVDFREGQLVDFVGRRRRQKEFEFLTLEWLRDCCFGNHAQLSDKREMTFSDRTPSTSLPILAVYSFFHICSRWFRTIHKKAIHVVNGIYINIAQDYTSTLKMKI